MSSRRTTRQRSTRFNNNNNQQEVCVEEGLTSINQTNNLHSITLVKIESNQEQQQQEETSIADTNSANTIETNDNDTGDILNHNNGIMTATTTTITIITNDPKSNSSSDNSNNTSSRQQREKSNSPVRSSTRIRNKRTRYDEEQEEEDDENGEHDGYRQERNHREKSVIKKESHQEQLEPQLQYEQEEDDDAENDHDDQNDNENGYSPSLSATGRRKRKRTSNYQSPVKELKLVEPTRRSRSSPIKATAFYQLDDNGNPIVTSDRESSSAPSLSSDDQNNSNNTNEDEEDYDDDDDIRDQDEEDNDIDEDPENHQYAELKEKDTKTTLNQARTEVNQIKSNVELTMQKMYQLKMDELDIELKLLEDGVLPEYTKALEDLEKQKSERINVIEQHFKHTQQNIRDFYAATEFKYHQTFRSETRDLRTELLEETYRKLWQLEAEWEACKKPEDSFMDDALLVYRKRKAALHYAKNSRDALPENVGWIPNWTRSSLRRHRYTSTLTAIVPPMCIGLKEHEKNEDLAGIRLLTQN